MVVKVSRQQALAWRMRRQLLDPVGGLLAAGIVRRVCGVQAQVASSAELAACVRREAKRRRAAPPFRELNAMQIRDIGRPGEIHTVSWSIGGLALG